MIKDMIRKFTKYATVGLFGALTHIGILVAFVELLNQNPVLSSTVGFIVALAVSYYLNHCWTFQSDRGHIYALPQPLHSRFFSRTIIKYWYYALNR